jgi:hypothetical protein
LACKKAFTSLFCLRESVYLRDAGSDETGNKGARGGEARDSELEDHGAWAAWNVGPVACGSKLPACAPRFCLLFPVPYSCCVPCRNVAGKVSWGRVALLRKACAFSGTYPAIGG